MAACTLCGGCNAGCNDGAKGTLSVSYLADAASHGAAVFTSVDVHSVTRGGDAWLVACNLLGLGRERFGAPRSCCAPASSCSPPGCWARRASCSGRASAVSGCRTVWASE